MFTLGTPTTRRPPSLSLSCPLFPSISLPPSLAPCISPILLPSAPLQSCILDRIRSDHTRST